MANTADMPLNGLTAVPEASKLPLERIPNILVRCSSDAVPDVVGVPGSLAMEVDAAGGTSIPALEEAIKANPSPLTCPECGGTLTEINEKGFLRFRCHVGHAYSADTLDNEQSVQFERSLWSAIRLFEERASYRRRLAYDHRQRGLTVSAEILEEKARESEGEAEAIRRMLVRGSYAGREPSEAKGSEGER